MRQFRFKRYILVINLLVFCSTIFSRPNEDVVKKESNTIDRMHIIKASFSRDYYYAGLQLLLIGAYEGVDLLAPNGPSTLGDLLRWGTFSESPSFMENIALKFGISNPTFLLLTKGGPVAAVADYESFNVVIADQDFYNNATLPEKTFVIGHEFAHLKRGHSDKKAVLSTLSTPLIIAAIFATDAVLGSAIDKIKQKFNVKEEGYCARLLNTIKKGYHICSRSPLFHWWAIKWCNYAFSRRCEREADHDAAIILDCAKGGISFFKQLENKQAPMLRELRFKVNDILGFVSHPSHAERIADLGKILQK